MINPNIVLRECYDNIDKIDKIGEIERPNFANVANVVNLAPSSEHGEIGEKAVRRIHPEALGMLARIGPYRNFPLIACHMGKPPFPCRVNGDSDGGPKTHSEAL